VAILANGLFRLIHETIQAVARFDLFHAATIFFRVRFGFDPHLFRFVLGQAGRGLDGDRLFLPGGLVLGRHVGEAVVVDIEGDFDVRDAARGGRNAVQLEGAERTVVLGELAFALHYVNLNARLVVGSRRVGFYLARRDGGVARNLHGHHAAQGFHTERER